jgi:hypothetical protein
MFEWQLSGSTGVRRGPVAFVKPAARVYLGQLRTTGTAEQASADDDVGADEGRE